PNAARTIEANGNRIAQIPKAISPPRRAARTAMFWISFRSPFAHAETIRACSGICTERIAADTRLTGWAAAAYNAAWTAVVWKPRRNNGSGGSARPTIISHQNGSALFAQ